MTQTKNSIPKTFEEWKEIARGMRYESIVTDFVAHVIDLNTKVSELEARVEKLETNQQGKKNGPNSSKD